MKKSIARKILDINEHDNTTLGRLASGCGYQEYEYWVMSDRENGKTIYRFEDGSSLIDQNNDWIVIS